MNFLKKLPYIIAEVGVNHNGKIDNAIKSINLAAKSGANAVKFQLFKTDEFMSQKKLSYKYKTAKGFKTENMYKMFKRLEFSNTWIKKIIAACKKNNVDFLCSVADNNSVNLVRKHKIKVLKLSSEDLINYPLLKYISKINTKVILSTGMAKISEIDAAIKILNKNKKDLVLLHCVSLYPTPDDETNLLRMLELKKKYKLNVGYSDHTKGIEASISAIALGAKLIEKHFTINKKMVGPDHLMSSDPREFKLLSVSCKRAYAMLGEKEIKPSKTEMIMKNIYRRSITSLSEIQKGEKLSLRNLGLKRPAHGLHPNHLQKILGKKAKRKILVDEKFKLSDIV